MEEEVRQILRDAVMDERYASRPRRKGRARKGFGTEVAELFRGIEPEEPIPELRGYSISLSSSIDGCGVDLIGPKMRQTWPN